MAQTICFLKIEKMANNKNVVEMLVKYLASLSELIEKWNIWGLDITKTLHLLHQIRKNDLKGLIEGTHKIQEIRLYKQENEKPKYEVLFDLGECILPENYSDENCMAMFRKKYRNEVYLSVMFSDENIQEATGITLKPGDKFHVLIYEFVSSNMLISSDDIRNFLQEQKALLLDAKGIAMVYDQKKDLIPKSEDYYFSFGKSGYLPTWLNFQSKKFTICYNSDEGDHTKGTTFFAFIPVI